MERQFFLLTLFSPFFFTFFFFFLFSFLFFFEHAYVEREKGLEKEKGGLNGWKVAETRASFDFSTLSFSRAISLASRWSNPSLDSHLDDRIEWTRTISGRLFARLGFNCSSRSFGLEVFDWISLLWWIKGLCGVSGREIWARWISWLNFHWRYNYWIIKLEIVQNCFNCSISLLKFWRSKRCFSPLNLKMSEWKKVME